MKKQKGKIRAGLEKAVRRGMALLLCAVLLAGTAPETIAGIFAAQSSIARAEAAVTIPKVYIGDTLLDATNDTYETSKARFAMVDGEAFLILNELDTGSGIAGHEFASGKYAGLYVDGDITLVLFKSNSITCAAEAATESYGIYVTGKLTLINVVGMKASLAAEGGDAAEVSAGIYADSISIPQNARQISLEEDGGIGRNQIKVTYSGVGVTLNATGGDVTYSGTEHGENIRSCGIGVAGYDQEAGSVSANGGSLIINSTNSDESAESIGLYAPELTQSGGILDVKGGTVTSNVAVNYWVFSYGVKCEALEVTGGGLTAEASDVNHPATRCISIGLYQKGADKTVVFSDCTVHAKAGKYGGYSAAYSNGGINCEGSVTIEGEARINAEADLIHVSGVQADATGLEARSICMLGGEIHASATGGSTMNNAIYVDNLFCIRKNSDAIVEAESGPTADVAPNAFVWSRGIAVGELQIEEESGAQVTATAESGAYGQADAYGIEIRSDGEIKSGTITTAATAANADWGNVFGIRANAGMCISGGRISAVVKGINFTSAGLCSFRGNGIEITGGEVTAVADLNGQTAVKKADYPKSCLAIGIYTESGHIGSISGGTVTARGSDLAVYNYGGVSLFNGAVLYASGNFEGSDAALLPESVYDIHRDNNELRDYKYLRSVAGTETAPEAPDVELTERYSKTDLEVDLSDTLPEDAGIVRYVTDVEKDGIGVLMPVVTDKSGVDSTNTSVSDISIDQETGILTAKMNAVLDSRDDMITIPVSVRSEKYATVLRNIIVTVSDKDVAVLEGVTQESTSYGQTLSAPVYTAPVTGGTETVSYSGKLADDTVYEASGTAPDQAGHYTVKVTYETDETRYIGKADFAIYPADISEAEVTLGEQAEADGSAHNVVIESVTVGGRTIVAGTDYEITAGGSATEIENTVATLTGIGNNCTGSRTFTWSLLKPAPAATDFTLPVIPAGGYDYSGAAVDLTAPVANVSGMGAVTVYYEGISGTSYEKTIEAPKDAGKYAVTFDVEEGTKYRAAEGLVIGELSISPVEYTGEKSVTVYVPGGRATEGVSLSLPLLPDGNYSTPETDCTWIDSESIQLNDNTLTLNTKEDTPEAGSVTVTIPVEGLRNYQAFSVSVYVEATALEETAVTITGEGVSDGHLRKTYGDAGFTLTAEAQKSGNGENVTWSSVDPLVADVDSEGNVTIGGIGETKIKAKYISDTSIGIGELIVTVDKKGVRVTGLDAADKVYDGTINATVTGTAVLAGLTEDDAEHGNVTVDTSLVVARFEDKNAGTGKTVTFSGAVLAGINAKNYKITEMDTGLADISPVNVTANVSAVSRAYVKDDLKVTLVSGAVSGVIGSDEVTADISMATAEMDDDAVGSDKAVTVSGVVLSGADAANYNLSGQPVGVKVNIQKAVWAGTAVQANAQPGGSAQIDLSEYTAPGAAPGTPEVISNAEALDGTPTLSGTKLGFSFKAGTKEGTVAEISVPMTGAENYNDYDITVTVTCMHDHVIVEVTAKAATCTEPGNTAHYKCSVEGCKKLFSDAEGINEVTAADIRIPALGHDWGEPSYVWSDDMSSVTATRICKHDDTHKDTETAAVTRKETPAGCESTGSIVYKAVFANAAFKEQTKEAEIKATGHDWGEWIVVKAATEDNKGEESRICKNDPSHVETREIPELSHKHTLVKHDAVAATETVSGNIEYWVCEECGRYFSDPEGNTEIAAEDTVIPAGKIGPAPTPGTGDDITPTPELKEGEVYVSPEDASVYFTPSPVVKNVPVTLTVNRKDISFSVSYTYTGAAVYTGNKILPDETGKAGIQAGTDLDGILAQVSFNGAAKKNAKEVFTVKYAASNNKNASRGKAALFYAKISINKGIDKQMPKDEYKKLKKMVSAANKAFKKNKCEFNINPKPVTEASPEIVAKYNKDNTLKLAKKTGLLSGAKVWVSVAKKTKLSSSMYTMEAPVTGEDGKVTVRFTGKKNYTGTAVVEVK